MPPGGGSGGAALRAALLHLVEIEGYEVALAALRRTELAGTPEGLSASFAEAGLALTVGVRRLARITAKDLPCVAETKDGACLSLLSLGRDGLRCAEGQTLLTLPAKRLKDMGLARLYACRPLAKVGGVCVAMKGRTAVNEQA